MVASVGSPYEAVLLDAGGVLLLPDPEVIRQVFAPFGLEPDDESCCRFSYLRSRELDRLGDPQWRAIDRAAAIALGVQDGDLVDVAGLLGDPFRESIPAPGVVDALLRLEQAGATLGVVSNSNGTLQERLAKNEICSVDGDGGVKVGVIVDSAIVGIEKPDPRIFAVALDALGVVPGRALYIGDTVFYDVNGARAAGLYPLHLDPYGLCPDHSHRHVASLAAVADLVVGR